AGEQSVDAALGVEQTGDVAGDESGDDRGEGGQEGVDSGDDEGRRGGAARGEASVDGEVGEVEDLEGQIDPERHRAVDEPEFQCSEHGFPFIWCVVVRGGPRWSAG